MTSFGRQLPDGHLKVVTVDDISDALVQIIKAHAGR